MDAIRPTQQPATALLKSLWWLPGVIAFRGAQIDVALHRHHALQLCLPLAGTQQFILENHDQITNSAVLLGSDIAHRLQGDDCLVLLIEPQSHLGQWLARRYLANGAPWQLLPVAAGDLGDVCPDNDVQALAERLWQVLDAPACRHRHLDPRLAKCLDRLSGQLALDGGSQLSAASMAEQAALSQSRFLHLFSEQMGIAWRPYLLWRRLLMAVQRVLDGESLTDAAHRAGFADAAHFSRTFKSMFGTTAKKVLGSLSRTDK